MKTVAEIESATIEPTQDEIQKTYFIYSRNSIGGIRVDVRKNLFVNIDGIGKVTPSSSFKGTSLELKLEIDGSIPESYVENQDILLDIFDRLLDLPTKLEIAAQKNADKHYEHLFSALEDVCADIAAGIPGTHDSTDDDPDQSDSEEREAD